MKPVTVDYTMADGETVPMSLNYGLLFKLRAKDKQAYKLYNETMSNAKDEPDFANAVILYAAYACAYLLDHDSVDDMTPMDEFMMSMSQDRQYNAQIAQELYAPNSK